MAPFENRDTRLASHQAVIPVTAVVTAYRRIGQTLETLRRLQACRPAPSEIIVHVDGNQTDCAAAVRSACPGVRLIVSEANVGPGGGRNQLLEAATQPIVASFDDDSYPIDADYFAHLSALFVTFSDASIVCAHVYHVGERIEPKVMTAEWVADFTGGACAYRRETFASTGGYVPLPTAYGMEEVDLALRLHAQGGRILRTSLLRVFHDTDRARHADEAITAACIANLALLTYLRYPPTLWILGVAQCVKLMRWFSRHKRRGIVAGLRTIPLQLMRHRSYRRRVPARKVLSYLALRKHPGQIVIELPETPRQRCRPERRSGAGG